MLSSIAILVSVAFAVSSSLPQGPCECMDEFYWEGKRHTECTINEAGEKSWCYVKGGASCTEAHRSRKNPPLYYIEECGHQGPLLSRDADNTLLYLGDKYVCGKNFDDHHAWTACREGGYDHVVSWTRKEMNVLDAETVELPRCPVRTDSLRWCDPGTTVHGVTALQDCGTDHGVIQLECGMAEPNVQEIRAQVCCMSQYECESSASSLAPIFPEARMIEARCTEGLPLFGANTQNSIILRNQTFGLDGNTWDVTYRITTRNAEAKAAVEAKFWTHTHPAHPINQRIVNALHAGLIKESHISEERQLSLSEVNIVDDYMAHGQYFWEPTPPKQSKAWVVWVVFASVGVCTVALMCGWMYWMQTKIKAVHGEIESSSRV